MIKPHIGMIARTGEKCPKSGVWKVVGATDTTTMSVSRGNRMPMHNNKSARWRLVIMF